LASPSISGIVHFNHYFKQADVNILKLKWCKYWCYTDKMDLLKQQDLK
jgi:hypothetical protein